MRGISMLIPGDFRLADLSISTTTGEIVNGPTVTLRTDMWPQWGREAIDAAVDARGHAALLPAALDPLDEEEVSRLAAAELRASLRSLCAAAFTFDGLYASVTARAGLHPHAHLWRENGTSRPAQIVETLRLELRLSNPETKQLKAVIHELFKYRDWAVHPGARFATPVYRDDLDVAADWHFSAFRARNAEHAASVTSGVVDGLVDRMPKARSAAVRAIAEMSKEQSLALVELSAKAHLRLNPKP